jgi:hypothetical protein
MFNKSYLLCAALCACAILGSQAQTSPTPAANLVQQHYLNMTPFESVRLFRTAKASAPRTENGCHTPRLSYLTLDPNTMRHIARTKPAAMTLTIGVGGTEAQYDLVQVSPEQLDCFMPVGSNPLYHCYEGVNYVGIRRGDDYSVIALGCFEQQVVGMIDDAQTGPLLLERLDDRPNTRQYALNVERTRQRPADEGVVAQSPYESVMPVNARR